MVAIFLDANLAAYTRMPIGYTYSRDIERSRLMGKYADMAEEGRDAGPFLSSTWLLYQAGQPLITPLARAGGCTIIVSIKFSDLFLFT